MPKIYTKTGDRGETGLFGGRRVGKDHPRVRAYGEIDELNSVMGLAIANLTNEIEPLRPALGRIQEELFVVGAVLATPPEEKSRLGPPFDRGIPAQAPARLEREIDQMTSEIKPLKHFVLPGGATPAAWLHFARTVCRRAERETVALREREQVPETILVYLNRLSDYLFTAARWANGRMNSAETPWQGLGK